MEESNGMYEEVFRARIGDLKNYQLDQIIPQWIHDWIIVVRLQFLIFSGNTTKQRPCQAVVCPFETSKVEFT